jgi:hypothetical protein
MDAEPCAAASFHYPPALLAHFKAFEKGGLISVTVDPGVIGNSFNNLHMDYFLPKILANGKGIPDFAKAHLWYANGKGRCMKIAELSRF